MNKNLNKPNLSSVSVPRQSKVMPISSPPQTHNVSRPRTAATSAPTHEEIAKRAYEIYVEKGCPQGQSEQIWQQAEQEQKSRDLTTFLSK